MLNRSYLESNTRRHDHLLRSQRSTHTYLFNHMDRFLLRHTRFSFQKCCNIHRKKWLASSTWKNGTLSQESPFSGARFWRLPYAIMDRLSDLGYRVGLRVHELTSHREKSGKRENRVLGLLYFIHTTVWKGLFGKAADALEKGTESVDECKAIYISSSFPIHKGHCKLIWKAGCRYDLR